MVDAGVFEVVPEAEVLSSTWVMKKKANGVCRAQMTAQGFEQIDREHYDEDDEATPVVSDVTIHVTFVLMIMAAHAGHIMDIKGAFLFGKFNPKHCMHLGILQGFERFLLANGVLLLLQTLPGTKQAALAFWKMIVLLFLKLKYSRSKVDT
jgi:hypothetical protein